jgi:hypothetical protein
MDNPEEDYVPPTNMFPHRGQYGGVHFSSGRPFNPPTPIFENTSRGRQLVNLSLQQNQGGACGGPDDMIRRSPGRRDTRRQLFDIGPDSYEVEEEWPEGIEEEEVVEEELVEEEVPFHYSPSPPAAIIADVPATDPLAVEVRPPVVAMQAALPAVPVRVRPSVVAVQAALPAVPVRVRPSVAAVQDALPVLPVRVRPSVAAVQAALPALPVRRALPAFVVPAQVALPAAPPAVVFPEAPPFPNGGRPEGAAAPRGRARRPTRAAENVNYLETLKARYADLSKRKMEEELRMAGDAHKASMQASFYQAQYWRRKSEMEGLLPDPLPPYLQLTVFNDPTFVPSLGPDPNVHRKSLQWLFVAWFTNLLF